MLLTLTEDNETAGLCRTIAPSSRRAGSLTERHLISTELEVRQADNVLQIENRAQDNLIVGVIFLRRSWTPECCAEREEISSKICSRVVAVELILMDNTTASGSL